MEKLVSYEKMSKKAQAEYNKSKRTLVGFNTGTQIHNTTNHPSRAKRKAMDRAMREERDIKW